MNTESTVGSRGQEDHLSATEMGRHNRVWPDPKRSKVRAEPPPQPHTHTTIHRIHLTLTWRCPARCAPGQGQNSSGSHPIIYLLTPAEPLYRWDTVSGRMISWTKASNLMRDPIDCRAVPQDKRSYKQSAQDPRKR